ncbi:hypothetical protein [Pseudonocardia spirodelae]|uniref:Uncharacterized protein n=1 Tax=Pseudonocardia spirodelae TaxID=3133431 RepID=A0ABU8T6L4_9PSEU
MSDRPNTPGPSRTTTRQVTAWLLVAALVAVPLSYLVGVAGLRVVTVLVVVAAVLGGLGFWLHRRTR